MNELVVIDSYDENHIDKLRYIIDKFKFASVKYTEIERDHISLVNELETIYNNYESVKVIHLSIGIEYYVRELEEICLKLFEKGIYIVNAYANNGIISYPAAFGAVIGVSLETGCNGIMYTGDSTINCICGMNKVETSKGSFEYGSSYSTVYVTVDVLDSIANKDDIKDKYALEKETLFQVNQEVDEKINNAYVYPYEKETSTLLRNYNSNKIENMKLFIEKGMIGDGDIEEYDSIINCDYKCDLFIIGHCANSKLTQSRKREIVSECIKRNIKIYQFDENNIEESNELLTSALQLSQNNRKLFKKLYYINTPIVTVFGTSSKQGKFTLLNKINANLKDMNFDIKSLSTEPYGHFCNCDSVYANGFGGVSERFHKDVAAINNKLMELSYTSPDIISTSTQSGVLPRSIDNLSYITANCLSTIYACSSDVNILVYNSYDSEEFINRCKLFIQATTGQEVQIMVRSDLEMFKSDAENSMNSNFTINEPKAISETIVSLLKGEV